jgi:hypothetical protein
MNFTHNQVFWKKVNFTGANLDGHHRAMLRLAGFFLEESKTGTCRRAGAKTPAMAARLTDHVWTVEELL